MNETVVENPAGAVAAPPLDLQTASQYLAAQGMRVYNPADFQFDPDQQTDDPIIKAVVGKATSKFALKSDQNVLSASGIPKNPDEKYFDYPVRVINQLKEQIKLAPDADTIKKEYETKLTEKDRALAEVSLIGAIRGLKLNVAPESQEMQQELLLMRALTLPHRVEGRDIVFQKVGDDGKTMIDVIDPATSKPISATRYLETQFKSFLAPVETPAQGPNARPKPADTSKAIPTTMEEIGAELIAEGFVPGPLFTAEAQKRKVSYAITDKK